MLSLSAFTLELTKIAEASKEDKPSYGKAFLAGLPVVGAQALSDVPESMIERSVQNKILRVGGQLPHASGLTASGAKFLSRIGAGSVTTPLFLSGLKDIKEARTRKDEIRGTGKLLAAGAVYSGLRGTLDSALDNEYGHLSKWDQAKKVIGPKALRGIGSAALVGYTVGHGLKETKGKKNSFSNRYLKPAAIGALTSAAGGLYESGLAEGFATPAARTRVAAKVGGKAAAGAAAGLFLSELMSRVLGKEKKASEQVPPPGPSGIYREVSSVARNADDKNLLQFYGDMHRRGAERTPSARAATYALHDELVRRGHSVETPKMREKVSPLMSPQTQDAGLVYAALSAPVAFLSVIDKSKTAKDQLMLDAVDQMYIRDQINWVKDPKLSLLGGHSAGTSITTHPDALLAEVAHELGHARGGVARKALRNIPHLDTARFVAAEVSILLPAFVVFGASDPSYSSPEELRQKASFLQTAGLALGAVQAPGIAEEVLATRDAVKILKSVGADSGDMARYSKVLGPALLTHAAPAALPFLASAVLRHRARKAEKSRSES